MIIYKVNKSKGVEVYVDADFAGGWSSADADISNYILSWTGFVICYVNCPLIWCSKLQTKIALSTAEAEYCNVVCSLGHNSSSKPCQGSQLHFSSTRSYYKLFALWFMKTTFLLYRLAESLKFTPHIKHIAIKYHHFCSRVQTSINRTGDIKLKYILTK
jgi:hypothetical protein